MDIKEDLIEKIKESNAIIKNSNDNIVRIVEYINLKFNNTQPKGIDLTKEKINGGVPSDKFFQYMWAITKEDLDEQLIIYQEEKKINETFVNECYKTIRKLQDNGLTSILIIYLRDELGAEWMEISRIAGYGMRHCFRLYKTEKEKMSFTCQ